VDKFIEAKDVALIETRNVHCGEGKKSQTPGNYWNLVTAEVHLTFARKMSLSMSISSSLGFLISALVDAPRSYGMRSFITPFQSTKATLLAHWGSLQSLGFLRARYEYFLEHCQAEIVLYQTSQLWRPIIATSVQLGMLIIGVVRDTGVVRGRPLIKAYLAC
jgi:hypothetical protein